MHSEAYIASEFVIFTFMLHLVALGFPRVKTVCIEELEFKL